MKEKRIQVEITADQKSASESPDFWFRLRIELSPLQRFNSDDAEMTFRLDEEGKDVLVRAAPRGKLSQAKTIYFDVRGFDSKEEAHEVGLRLKKAVVISAAVETIGVDAGIDQLVADESDSGQRAKGYRVKDIMQGLTVHGGELTGGYMSNAHIVHAPDPKGLHPRN